MATSREIVRLRLSAQRLVGTRPGTAAEVVRHMTALQGQDLPGVMTSIALRTARRDRAEVVRGMNDGEIVRSWPMRSTLHAVPARDLGWMLALTAPGMLAGAATRRQRLGVDDEMVARARDLARDALSGGGSLGRAELLALWEKAGLLDVPQRGYHLLVNLSQRGVLCFGPHDGREQRVVLLEEWVPRPRTLERDEALGEWVLRYFRSHGPATVRDFAWWTKLPMREVRAGLAVARRELATTEVGGVEYLMDPATPDLLAAARKEADGLHLLPGFDEFVLGYSDRGAAIPDAHADAIVPGNNGMFRGTVVAGASVVGTWKKGRGGVDATPFTEFTAAVRRALPRVAGALPQGG